MTEYKLIDRSDSGYIGDIGRYDIQVVAGNRHVAWITRRTRTLALDWCREGIEARRASGMAIPVVTEWNGTEWAEVAAVREP